MRPQKLSICLAGAAPWYAQLRQRVQHMPQMALVAAAADSDVLVCPHAPHAAAAEAAAQRYGLLFFDVDENFGLTEVLKRQPVTTVRLWHQPPNAAAVCVGESTTSTRHLWSRNRDHALEKAVSLLIKALQNLQRGTPLAVLTQAVQQTYPAHQQITLAQRGQYAGVVARWLFMRLRDKFWHKLGWQANVWQLHVTADVMTDLMAPSAAQTFQPLLPAASGLMADPFLFTHGGTDYLFFEHIPPGAGKGHISYVRLSDKNLVPETALAADIHLSYPQVFAWQNQIYMLPETSANKRLELWRAIDFPTRWELAQTALEGISVADATLWLDGQDIWLFANLSFDRFRDHNTELHIYKLGANLLQDITPHAHNPVVLDTRYARGAGALFRDAQGRLLRPSQCNDMNTYGRALNLMEIQALSLTTYQETCRHRLDVQHLPNSVGVHHVARWGQKYIVDICQRWQRKV